MRRCLDLALNGAGLTSPNPLVGAVIVHNNRIIGEGFHTGYGNAHAEVEAVRSVKESDRHLLSAATLYVNLEPCSHHGKTPPCTDLILHHNIRNVVVGLGDPNPLVNGNGLRTLRNAGVSVIDGVLTNECLELNKRFYTFHQKQRPYVVLKWAQSCDGFIATRPSQRTRISNALSDVMVHKWRSEESAILVGYNTALTDDPRLSVREWKGKNPLRLVYDPELALPSTLKMFNDVGETWILNHTKEESNGNVSYKKVTRENWSTETLQMLHDSKRLSLLIEGGTKTLETFIRQGLWDETRIITSPLVLQDGLRAPAPPFSKATQTTLGDNQLDIYTRR